MKGSNIEKEYTDYWINWRESERKYYKLLAPTQEELQLEELKLRLLRANELKERGNTFFRNKDYSNAIQKYMESIENVPKRLFLVYFTSEYTKIQLAVITNLSICFAKSNNNESAIAQCKEGLKVFPNNVKLRYILGGVLGDVQEYDESLKILKEAKDLEPNNREVIERIKVINNSRKEYNAKMKEMFGGKFKPVIKQEIIIKEQEKLNEEEKIHGEEEEKILITEKTNNWGYYILGAASLIGLAGLLYKKLK